MARSGDDWDELTERTRQRKQTRRKRNRRQRSAEEQADHDYNEEHTSKFVSELAKKDSQYNWMKDDKNKRMFQKIEKRIQGAMGSGTYDWVDRRVFDQVFDRLTLMSLYKLMNAGSWIHLIFQLLVERKHTCSMEPINKERVSPSKFSTHPMQCSRI